MAKVATQSKQETRESVEVKPEDVGKLQDLGKLPAVGITESQLPSEDFVDDLDQYVGAGLQHVESSDIIIPRMVILQSLSPQLNPGKVEYIEGAKLGEFCNTATGDIFEREIEVLPVYFIKNYIEWKPNRAGLQQNHGPDDTEYNKIKPNDKGRHVKENGNTIVETYTFYCINIIDGKRIFIPLSSTQAKHARNWLTAILGQREKRKDGKEYQPAIWIRSWFARTIDEQNPSGSWKSWKFTPAKHIRELGNRIKEEAIQFSKDVETGVVKGDLIEDETAHQEGGRGPVDDNKPF